MTSNLATTQIARLQTTLAPLHAEYNPEERALRRPFSSPGYHTTLKGGQVHPTRESLEYAVAILDTGEAEMRDRSEAIIRRIIAEQDQDPQSKTYGIWSWFLDEPLSQMAPPDWNWADFCGTQLLQVALFHRDRFDPQIMELIKIAIVHAARSIERRNVGPHYTNIAIMGTYVTLVAAQLYDLPDIKQYALARLKRFHEYTVHNGGFSEFNSPTYTIVALKELGRLRRDVRVPEAKVLIEDLYTKAWEEIAIHFHVPTRQWSGPHSRWYRSLMDDATLALIERSIQRPLGWNKANAAPSMDEHRLPLPCPPQLESQFVEPGEARQVVKTFQQDFPRLIGTTYLTPTFSLGSINALDLWNQRRSLLAYWGTPDKPAYLRLRFLHDDYDFTAAQFYSTQQNGDVLAGISFATDGGDTHPNLDRLKTGDFKARDLRLRLELGGDRGDIHPTLPTDPHGAIDLTFNSLHIQIATPVIQFNGLMPTWTFTKNGDASGLDLVFYSGPARDFNLAQMNLVIGLTVSISDAPLKNQILKQSYGEGSLAMQWKGMQLKFPAVAQTKMAMQQLYESINR